MGITVRGLIRFFTVRAFEVLVAVLLITFMPNIPPHAKISEPYSVAPSLPLEGKLAINDRLEGAEVWHKSDLLGPETFAEYNGELYTGLHGGDIVKITGEHITPVAKFGKPCKGVYQEQVCGRPLGLQFDKSGALYVADAYYGLFKVDVKTGKKLQLVSVDHEINGKKPKLPNSLAVASNGDIYWTDSSSEFVLSDGIFDMLSDGSGRLIHYDAKTKKNTVLLEKLQFANGVALSSDESFLIVAETGRGRIHRYYLRGPKQGTHDIFIDGLPGLPDNLHGDGHGGFWVPLVVARDPQHPSLLQIFGPFPLARKFIARLFGLAQLGFKIVDQVYPNEYAERGIHFVGHFSSTTLLLPKRVSILRVSERGEIIESLHAMDKRISGICEAFVFKDHLYLGSPFNDYIGRVSLIKSKLQHLAVKTRPETKQTVPPKQAPPTTPPPPRKEAPTAPQSKQAPSTVPLPVKQAPTTPPPAKQAPATPPPPKQVPTTPPPAKQPPPQPVKQPPPTTPQPAKQPPPTTPQPAKQPRPTTPQPARQPPPTTQPAKQPPPTSPQPAKQPPPTTTTTTQPAKQPSPTTPPAKQVPPSTAPPPKQDPTTKQVPTTPPPAKQSPPPVKQTDVPSKQEVPKTMQPPKQAGDSKKLINEL